MNCPYCHQPCQEFAQLNSNVINCSCKCQYFFEIPGFYANLARKDRSVLNFLIRGKSLSFQYVAFPLKWRVYSIDKLPHSSTYMMTYNDIVTGNSNLTPEEALPILNRYQNLKAFL